MSPNNLRTPPLARDRFDAVLGGLRAYRGFREARLSDGYLTLRRLDLPDLRAFDPDPDQTVLVKRRGTLTETRALFQRLAALGADPFESHDIATSGRLDYDPDEESDVVLAHKEEGGRGTGRTYRLMCGLGRLAPAYDDAARRATFFNAYLASLGWGGEGAVELNEEGHNVLRILGGSFVNGARGPRSLPHAEQDALVAKGKRVVTVVGALTDRSNFKDLWVTGPAAESEAVFARALEHFGPGNAVRSGVGFSVPRPPTNGSGER